MEINSPLEVGLDDEKFDLNYPRPIQDLSDLHWTPVGIARRAARLLVTKPGTRVLDIGCGPGKFCVAAAMATDGHFTGIEQREHLAAVARYMVRKHRLSNVEIIHANITDIDFGRYDAFYLYNPFQENTAFIGAIDSTVELSEELYNKYTKYVATQLALAPTGTRVVTYVGLCEEIPDCYDLKRSDSTYNLKLWIKSRKTATDSRMIRGITS
ncbi:MAG: class I SAM-dependent methyltransferase [Methylacidiphilales bacterium]|nr:class I SAM-dependent methyltransferase [Candidatus Methylacidiphilales bacterium]